ncbi:MAG: hypothetical protein WB689_27460 [Xanthobacteraceae bacterium]
MGLGGHHETELPNIANRAHRGFEGFSSTPEELGDFIKAQLALWGKMIKDSNIQLD